MSAKKETPPSRTWMASGTEEIPVVRSICSHSGPFTSDVKQDESFDDPDDRGSIFGDSS